jgi:hypothetical protein
MLDFILNKLLADSSGTPDDARWCAVLIVLVYCFMSVFSLTVSKQAFDAQQFGIGAGAISAGIGGWFRLRGPQ